MNDIFDPDQGVYTISVAAEILDVHPQTLRMYERKGLIEPSRTRGRARLYSPDDIERVRRIQELTQGRGVNLAGVKIIVELERRITALEKEIKLRGATPLGGDRKP